MNSGTSVSPAAATAATVLRTVWMYGSRTAAFVGGRHATMLSIDKQSPLSEI